MSRAINNTLRFLHWLVADLSTSIPVSVQANDIADKLEVWCKANKIRVPRSKSKLKRLKCP